ncbi:MAG: ribonuclease P protein component [Hyphomonadaceae bacterium]|nr:ribonuclease P protein component [Hyphomonadaceae bacterium]
MAVSIQKLRKRGQFLFVRAGARAGRPSVTIEARRRAEDGPIGVGFTASRKVGPAVVRNRARRRLREAARQLLALHGLAGVDYVLVARQSTPDADWAALLDDVGSALIRLRADLTSGAESRQRQRASQLSPRPAKPRKSD